MLTAFQRLCLALTPDITTHDHEMWQVCNDYCYGLRERRREAFEVANLVAQYQTHPDHA